MPGEERDVAAERQPLVADLRRRGEDDVADPLGRDLRVAAQQLAHRLHAHVVGARAPELALRARPCRTPSARRRRRRPRAPSRIARTIADLTDRSISRAVHCGDRALGESRPTTVARYRRAASSQLDAAATSGAGPGSCSHGGRSDRDESAEWLRRAAARYRESWRGCTAGLVGPADRRDEGAPARRATDASAGALGARRRRGDGRIRRSAATPARSRSSCSATTSRRALVGSTLRDRDDFPRGRRRRARRRSPRRPRRLLHRARGRPRVVRGATRLPRGRPGRRHRARAAGARGVDARAAGRPARFAAPLALEPRSAAASSTAVVRPSSRAHEAARRRPRRLARERRAAPRPPCPRR